MKTLKVLLADGSITIQKLVNVSLAGRVGEVIFATDSQDALLKARRLKPDLILLDSGMLKISGVEVSEKLKQEGCQAKLVYLQPAGESNGSQFDGVQLEKPFNSEKLLAAIAEALERPAEEVVGTEQSEEVTQVRGGGPFSSFRAAEEGGVSLPEGEDNPQQGEEGRPEASTESPSSVEDDQQPIVQNVSQKLAAIASELIPLSRSESSSETPEIEESSEPVASSSLQAAVESPGLKPEVSAEPQSAEEPLPKFTKDELVSMARFEIQSWIDREMPQIAERLIKKAISEKTRQ